MITVPDWTKAPADATHFLPEDDLHYAAWMKRGYSMRVGSQDAWVKNSWRDEVKEDERLRRAVSRSSYIPNASSDSVMVPRATLELCAYALREEGYHVMCQKLKGLLAEPTPAQTEQQPIRLPERKNLDGLRDPESKRAGMAYNEAIEDVELLNAAPIAQTEQTLREAFEVWWSATMNTVEMDLWRFGDGYACHETNIAWMAWQAQDAQNNGPR